MIPDWDGHPKKKRGFPGRVKKRRHGRVKEAALRWDASHDLIVARKKERPISHMQGREMYFNTCLNRKVSGFRATWHLRQTLKVSLLMYR